MSEPTETLLAINPKSRSGDLDCSAIADTLRTLGPVHRYTLDGGADLNDLIERHAGRLARIVVGGGDGTLNSALGAIVESGLPLGVLPLGTANDFARSLELPLDPLDAARVILEGHIGAVDLGRVNGHYFLNAVGVGLGPRLSKELTAEKKARFGVLSYLATLLQTLKARRSFTVELDTGDRVHRTRCMQVTIANGIHYGGGMTIDASARVDDGLLDAICVPSYSLWQLAFKLLAFRWGQFAGAREILRLHTPRLSLTTRRPMDASVDGEVLTRTPLSLEVVPRVLSVYLAPQREP